MDKAWRFHSGDERVWANPSYDAQEWQPIDPTNDIKHIPQLEKTSILMNEA